MHYLFFDEAYHHKKPGEVVFAGWAVEQNRLNSNPMRPQDLCRTPVLNSIDGILRSLDAWAIVTRASLDTSLFRSGDIDGTDDVVRMSRTDNVWATCSTFLVTSLLAGYYKRREELATVDVYHDPKGLTAAHDEARRNVLRGPVVRHAKQFSISQNKRLFKKLSIRRIESVTKPSDLQSATKFQIGVWVSDRLCSSADTLEASQFSRIRSFDMSEEVRRTIQQYDGKRFEDD